MKRYQWAVRTAVIAALAIAAVGCRKKDIETKADGVRMEDLRTAAASFSGVVFEGSEDSQPYWNVFDHQFAAGEDGYYYMFKDEQGIVLEHVDADTGKRTVLCNRPQCAHDVAECPAFFGSYNEYAQAVWNYQDHLYFIKRRADGAMVLVQTDKNVTARKELFEIGAVEANHLNMCNLTFCNGSVYIYDRTGNCGGGMGEVMQIYIRRRSLDGKEDEYIITSDEKDSYFDAMKAYGGNVFFIYQHATTDLEKYVTTITSEGLFCYNDRTGKSERLIDKEVCDYSVDEKRKILYYYVIHEGLYRYEFETGEERLIYSCVHNSELCQVSCDGNYIYLDNGRFCAFMGGGLSGKGDTTLSKKVWILDSEGKVLHEVDNKDVSYASFFGDDRCILAEMNYAIGPWNAPEGYVFGHQTARERIVLEYILKSDIPSETLEWKRTTWE